MADTAAGEAVHRLAYVPTSGIEAGGPVMWFGDVAHDQRPTDAFSLVYDTAPLDRETEILGFPRALLQVAADAPMADWFARLSDVAPDGTVTLVASAGLNGTHRESDRTPRALVPGERVGLEIEMHFTSWVFAPGHRMRLSVSNAQWPMIWPTPYTMTTSLFLGGEDGTRLLLPVVPPGARPVPDFAPSPDSRERLPGYEPIEAGSTSGYGEISRIERNPQTHTSRVVATNDSGMRYPWGEQHETERITYEADDRRPEAATVHGEYSTTVVLKGRTLRWESRVSLTSDRTTFHYTNVRRLFENGVLIREKTWNEAIPRDFQ
ncbi:MAG: CocE/NonD family hydrolase, partial [Vicinamibacterales bacterium]